MIFCALSSFLKLQSRQYWIYLSFKKPSGNQDFYIFTESVWGNELLSSKFRVINWSTWNCKPFFLMNFAKIQIYKYTLENVKTTFSSLQAIQWKAVRLWLDVGVYIQTSCRKLYKKLVQNQNPKYDSTELLSALWSWILWIPGIIASKVSSVRLRIFTRQETISQVLPHLQQSVSIHCQSLQETWYTSLYWPANYNLIQGSVGNNEFECFIFLFV